MDEGWASEVSGGESLAPVDWRPKVANGKKRFYLYICFFFRWPFGENIYKRFYALIHYWSDVFEVRGSIADLNKIDTPQIRSNAGWENPGRFR